MHGNRLPGGEVASLCQAQFRAGRQVHLDTNGAERLSRRVLDRAAEGASGRVERQDEPCSTPSLVPNVPVSDVCPRFLTFGLMLTMTLFSIVLALLVELIGSPASIWFSALPCGRFGKL